MAITRSEQLLVMCFQIYSSESRRVLDLPRTPQGCHQGRSRHTNSLRGQRQQALVRDNRLLEQARRRYRLRNAR